MAPISQQEAAYLTNHIFLPPGLPQTADNSLELTLIATTHEALVDFLQHVPVEHHAPIKSARDTVQQMRHLHAEDDTGVSVMETTLCHALEAMARGSTRSIVLNIGAQNAGLQINKEKEVATFEPFELSPTNVSVMSIKGRLMRTFPASAVGVPLEVFTKEGFCADLAQKISKMSEQPVTAFLSKVRKAGQELAEDRDTTDPSLVTEFLMAELKADGNVVPANTLTKHTREEVLWKTARSPWRRSPMWLLLRVALQLHFCRSSTQGTGLYKLFMAFLMGHVCLKVEAAQNSSVSSERLYCMNAKLARRVHKLSKSPGWNEFQPLLEYLQAIMQRTTAELNARWTRLQNEDCRPVNLNSLTALDFSSDTLVALPELDAYLASLFRRPSTVQAATFSPAPTLSDWPPEVLPNLTSVSPGSQYTVANLQAFERWITANLDAWITAQAMSLTTCKELESLLKSYHRLAKACYKGSPEATSAMVLTILDIWVACDKSACALLPLLVTYRPGMPLGVTQSLLLPYRSQMQRLQKIECYQEQRELSQSSADLLFSTELPNGFAAKFFDQSPKHQALLSSIQDHAQNAKNAKLQELDNTKAKYNDLKGRAEDMIHEYDRVLVADWLDPPEYRQHHRQRCKRCFLERQMKRMFIDVHEDPLPMGQSTAQVTQAKAIVVELDVPVTFAHWREARCYVMMEVLHFKLPGTPPGDSFKLCADKHLKENHFQSSKSRRIGLLTAKKSHAISHRSQEHVARARENTVCRTNGTNYRYYDSGSSRFIADITVTPDLAQECTYKLPGFAKDLQKYLSRLSSAPNGPAPNTVIANQHECPGDMGLDEYKELCTIPLGHRIQWQNILLQLEMPGVDFKKVETAYVVLQCIHQAGPAGHTLLRSAHKDFENVHLAWAIIKALHGALDRVKSNWQSSQALGTFVAIATRVLSLSDDDNLSNGCLLFLSKARDVAYHWMQLLRNKAHEVAESSHRTMFASRSVEVSLICASTFDVEGDHLQKVLRSVHDVSILVQCSITAREGKRTLRTSPSVWLTLLSLRIQRLLHRSKDYIALCQAGIQDAIQQAWPAYRPGSAWRALSSSVSYWLVSNTVLAPGTQPLNVQYNIVTGELLVEGLPLDRPPVQYEVQQLYSVLFGNAAVEVMPCNIPGMQFSAKRKFDGYTVNLGVLAGSDGEVVVQAARDTLLYETVPASVLQRAFPDHFHHDYVHWYNFRTREVEFRPKDDPWNATSSGSWRLVFDRFSRKWTLSKGDATLVRKESPTSRSLSSILEPLAFQTRIHSMLDRESMQLYVEIPSLQLGFMLDPGSRDLVSREYRGMKVDANQSVGTLVGFHSKLVLKPTGDGDRLILLPEADIAYCRDDAHISVTVTHKDNIHKVHPVRVDTRLGRLIDNGSLASKLQLVYLHALTAYCLPDPLTSRTGTEQALDMLASASLRSFDTLDQQSIDKLSLIAHLSPGRSYYPQDLQDMQTTTWNSEMSYLAQHEAYLNFVRSIFDQAKQYSVFYPASDIRWPALDHANQTLHDRGAFRSAAFRIAGYGADLSSANHDRQYAARDTAQDSLRAQKAYSMRTLVSRGCDVLRERSKPPGFLWDLIVKVPTVHGRNHTVAVSSLRYDGDYVSDGSTFLLKYFPSIVRVLTDTTLMSKLRCGVTSMLSTMAGADGSEFALVQLLAIASASARIPSASISPIDSFTPSQGKEPQQAVLRSIIDKHVRDLEFCPENDLKPRKDERLEPWTRRRDELYECNKDAALGEFVKKLMAQWPRAKLSTEAISTAVGITTYIDVDDAMIDVREKWQNWYHNSLLYDWLMQLEAVVRGLEVKKEQLPKAQVVHCAVPDSSPGYISIADLFNVPAPSTLSLCRFKTKLGPDYKPLPTANASSTSRLAGLINAVEASASSSIFEESYAAELRSSQQSLEQRVMKQTQTGYFDENDLTAHLEECTQFVKATYDCLVAALLEPLTIKHAYHLPRISPTFFLQQLARNRWRKLPEDWKACIIHYGVALTSLQRAKRMLKAFCVGGSGSLDLINEIRNAGHKNWNPMDHPERLLIEVESGIMIRDVQHEIAQEMHSPSSNENSVMQLNMGEGKSSVIVPIVAASLANGRQLVRAIVAKPQSKQMVQMLISKLGGIIGRRIYYMPFSRSLKPDEATADTVAAICRECMKKGGILLVQPEHILSLKLMAQECYIRGKDAVGCSLMSTQDFFHEHSRDIVDESDENFSVQFELIYTMGTQRAIEMSPERWLIIQEVLGLIKLLAPGIVSDMPSSMEIHQNVTGGFPRTRILRVEAESRLVRDIAQHICTYGLSAFPIARQPKEVRDAVHLYLTKFDLTRDEINKVENPGSGGFFADSVRNTLFLLRGLLAGGVITFVLGKKRWRVNYGTAARSPPTRLAVPYRAKDNPSPRSEFSHPDVVIMLTSLCYYYSGLDDDDLFAALRRLMGSDQADIEYQAWVKDANDLPPTFAQLQGVNLNDEPQCRSKLFPALRNGKSVVDYFLAQIVFPKEIKEFPFKLSASGWDIGMSKSHPTTGFSGTCDSKATLPLGVNHLDLPEQKHTNALVLEHLLQPENSVELMPPARDNVTTDADRLLDVVLSLKPEVHVILDVGAQILELNNIEVAKKWLNLHPDYSKEAVVYVNDKDEIWVINRQGRDELLQTSSYAARLDACLVFLDEAHTRGIDLKLPTHYRAAVTLGANLTKDRLVQACMRMRKLGSGQTVVFCISEEIQNKIMECTKRSVATDVSVTDVLHWAISETFIDTRRCMPLWAVQGQRFVKHEKIDKARRDGTTAMTADFAEKFQDPEARLVADRYRPKPDSATSLLVMLERAKKKPALTRIVERCQQFDGLQFNSSTLQEEQERELSPEIEEERQVQRPASAKPAKHILDRDIVEFVKRGNLVYNSKAFKPAFESVKDTTAATETSFEVLSLCINGKLLISSDCARTVSGSGPSFRSDQYQRPVQWLLTRKSTTSNTVDVAMIISPFEAEELLQYVRKSTSITLHMFKARCNLGYAALDKLALFTTPQRVIVPKLPRWLSAQLQLFSGQLYISSYDDYLEVCNFLGLSPETAQDGWEIAPDGFIVKDGQGRRGGQSGLSQSPVQFLKIFMSKVRRNGESIAKTHIGKILEGAILQPKDLNVKAASIDDKAYDSVLESDSE